MVDVVQDALKRGWDLHNEGKYDEAEKVYQGLLCRAPGDHQLLYLLGDIYLKRGWNGMAINLLSNAVSLRDDFRPAWINLGCAFKAEHYNRQAEESWLKAMEIEPNAEIYNNLATLYADSGMPEEALEHANKAREMLPIDQAHQMPHIAWNRALALLSKSEWKEGWKEHEARKILKSKSCSPRDYAPEWDGHTPVKRLIVHGEQGVGDEIMFLSCLPDLMEHMPDTEIVVECEPRLVPVVERSFGLKAYGTMKEVKDAGEEFDAQVAMGTLPMFYRSEDADFPMLADYLTPDPKLVEQARELLKDKPKPWIAVTWAGGTKATRVHHRSIGPKAITNLIPGTVIPLQHGPMADVDAAESGVEWFGEWSDGKDIEKQMAMIAVCDEVVTVAGTIVHLAGAMGKQAIVLTPKRSSWRYGMDEGLCAMRWYPQHILLRQPEEGAWQPVLDQLKEKMEERYGQIS